MFGRPLGRDFVRPARYHDTAALLASSQSNVDDPVADRGDRHIRPLQPNAPVATLPEPVHSAHVTIIAESVLRTAYTEAVLERIARMEPRLAQRR